MDVFKNAYSMLKNHDYKAVDFQPASARSTVLKQALEQGTSMVLDLKDSKDLADLMEFGKLIFPEIEDDQTSR